MYRNIISALAVISFLIVVSVYTRKNFQKQTTPPQTAITQSMDETNSSMSHGEALARKHCIECHEFTYPDLLTKKSWNFLLTYMGLRLGIEDFSYVKNPDDVEKRVLEARKLAINGEDLFPDEPAMPDEDWRILRQYYIDNAPEHPILPENKPASTGTVENIFKVKRNRFNIKSAVVSMTKIDSKNQQLLISEATRQKMTILDKDLDMLDAISSRHSFWVDAIPTENGLYLLSVGDIPGDYIGQKLGKIAYGKRMGDMYLTEGHALKGLYRPADMEFADLNNDGVDEILICNFGDEGGSFAIHKWKDGQNEIEEEPTTLLFEDTGPIKCATHDFNNDGYLDIVLLVSDVKEHLSLFINKQDGTFSERVIHAAHPSWGYMSVVLSDINGDGKMDIITGNGDNGDSDPYNTLKRYHGVRIYENKGNLQFSESYFYPMYGCYQVNAFDYDNDGDIDIAANAFHPDFLAETPENFVFLEQTDNMKFSPKHHPATKKGRWMTMDSGDIDQDGDIDIVFGGAYVEVGIPAERMDILDNFRENGPAILFLENKTNN